jgi:hypothetical protein
LRLMGALPFMARLAALARFDFVGIFVAMARFGLVRRSGSVGSFANSTKFLLSTYFINPAPCPITPCCCPPQAHLHRFRAERAYTHRFLCPGVQRFRCMGVLLFMARLITLGDLPSLARLSSMVVLLNMARFSSMDVFCILARLETMGASDLLRSLEPNG